MYWIEKVTAGHMDTALIPHITVAKSQKAKNYLKLRQRVITNL